MSENCIDCNIHYKGIGSRCASCYVKFALKRRVNKKTIRAVLNRMKVSEHQDIKEALTILQEGE